MRIKLALLALLSWLLLAAPSWAQAVVPATMRDANLTTTNTQNYITTAQPFTAPRTLTIPDRSSLNAYFIQFIDTAGAVSVTNTLTINVSGGQLINGQSTLSINTANNYIFLAPSSNGYAATIIPQTPGSDSIPASSVDFTQLGTGAVPQTVQNKLQENVSVLDFGCVGDGVHDNTACINAAFAASASVYLPPGNWHITDMLQCPASHTLWGASDTVSVITVGAATNDFNMSALGVVQPGTPGVQPGCTIRDIGISFFQPNFSGMTIANIIQYPPAIVADNIPQITLEGSIQITNAWSCISMLAPTNGVGGSQIARVKCSDYSLGLAIDGAVAGIHVGSWDEETFGMTANQLPVFASQGNVGSAVAMKFGRCDGCSVDALTTFTHGLTITPAAANIGGINIAIAQMDGAGANIINSGSTPLRIGTLYGTGFAGGGKIQTTAAGAVTVIGNIRLGDGATGCDINISNGTTVIGTGSYSVGTNTAANVCVTGGFLQMENMNFSTAASNRTAPVVLVTGGILDFIGNTTSGAGAATGSFIEIDNDNTAHYVSNNALNGWDVTLGFTTATGYYDFGDFSFPFTATPQFTTMGDFAPTSVATSGFMFRRGNFVDLSLSTTFTTNAYTTATGAFSLGMTAPAAVGGNQGCPITFMSNVVFGTNPTTAFISGSAMGLGRLASAGAVQNFGTANIPPSVAGINFNISCRYRVRT